MGSVVIFEEIHKVQEELNKKLDTLKFQVAMEDISFTIDSLKEKINTLDSLNIKDLNKVLESLSGMDNNKIDELLNLIKKYDELTSGTDSILESKVNDILIKSGVIDKLKDELNNKLNDVKNDIISRIKIPITVKDIDIGIDGEIDIGYEIIDILDFMVPIYSYDDLGRIVIKCMVSPKLADGKIKLTIDEESMKKLDLKNGLTGFKTSMQILTKIKE